MWNAFARHLAIVLDTKQYPSSKLEVRHRQYRAGHECEDQRISARACGLEFDATRLTAATEQFYELIRAQRHSS